MYLKKVATVGILSLALFGGLYFTGSLTGCVSIDGASGVQSLESMSDVEFARLKLLSSITVKVAANRLLESGQVTQADINLAVNVLNAITSTPVLGTGREFVQSLLADSGLTSLEIQSLVELVVFELEARGVLSNVGADGMIALTPRTGEFLSVLTQALLDSVSGVTEQEARLFVSSDV